MTKIGDFVRGLPVMVWIVAGALALAGVVFWRVYDAGGDHVRREVKEQTAEARIVTTKTTAEVQRDLDGTTAQIGEEIARGETETVRIVERAKVEIRHVAVAEADPLPGLTAWRDRARRLRIDLCLDGPAGADGAGPQKCPGTLPGAGAS